MGKMSPKVVRSLLILTCAIVLINSLRFNSPRKYNKDKSSISMKQSRYNILEAFRKQYYIVIIEQKPVVEVIAPVKQFKDKVFTVTAYTLGFESTQKSRGSSGYGITSNGYDLKGKSRISAQTIAIDKTVIPIGSKVRLTFIEEKYKEYDGIYFCRDTGGAVIGLHIDLFIGDNFNSNKRAINFGVTKCKVEIIK